jgi:hypothetical protein
MGIIKRISTMPSNIFHECLHRGESDIIHCKYNIKHIYRYFNPTHFKHIKEQKSSIEEVEFMVRCKHLINCLDSISSEMCQNAKQLYYDEFMKYIDEFNIKYPDELKDNKYSLKIYEEMREKVDIFSRFSVK